MRQLGVVAAGHELSARAGADALRAGGNAVDGALGALLAAVSCEPLLTGLGAGGYMLIAGARGARGEELEPVLLDFFVEAPGRGTGAPARAELQPVAINFAGGDTVQVFHIGPASVGTWGVPAGIAAASSRYGRLPLSALTAPAARQARDGVVLTEMQAHLFDILGELATATPEGAAVFAPGGAPPTHGAVMRLPELADALELLGEHGPEPFYTGEIGAAIIAWLDEHGGLVTRQDLAAYEVIERAPVRTRFRGREVLTNPPPSAGGILIARAMELLGEDPADPVRLVAAMEDAQAVRDEAFNERLAEPGFADRFTRGRHGSTTHISVLDADGMACSVTTSNGSSSGIVVPGTGVHLNNMLGEQDLNPLGFHRHPPGRRLPSMMSPTIVRNQGRIELVLGSAGSNRIRSAVLQTIVRVLDDGLDVAAAVRAPRLHFEDGIVYTEPGVDVSMLDADRYGHAAFEALSLFFGGVQAVAGDPVNGYQGGGDPRRGGAASVVES